MFWSEKQLIYNFIGNRVGFVGGAAVQRCFHATGFTAVVMADDVWIVVFRLGKPADFAATAMIDRSCHIRTFERVGMGCRK